MVELTKALGKTIICTDKELIHGVMAGNTKVNILWIKNMGTAFISGLMEGDTKDIGQMVNKMAKGNISYQMA